MKAQVILSDMERWLLNRIQYDFPIAREPYECLAREYGGTQVEIYRSVCNLRDKGIIRRIGASYVPNSLGYSTTLASAMVLPSALKDAALCAGQFPEVTHNYERINDFNLWFTVIASSSKKLQYIIDEVSKVSGVQKIHSLPACRTFKLKVNFHFDGREERFSLNDEPFEQQKMAANKKINSPVDIHKPLIAKTCGDIGTGLTPYCDLAHDIGLDSDELIKLLCAYRKAGIMRRFGAILQHQTAGFNGNAMVVWQVPDDRIEDIGRNFASFPEVSHCYQRKTVNGWPFNLYTMVHGKTRDQVSDLCKKIAKNRSIDNYQLLFSAREFKKTSMVYFPEEA